MEVRKPSEDRERIATQGKGVRQPGHLNHDFAARSRSQRSDLASTEAGSAVCGKTFNRVASLFNIVAASRSLEYSSIFGSG